MKVEDVFRQMSSLPEFIEVSLIDVNTVGNFGNTPMHVAAIWNDPEVISVLIKAGADMNVQGEHGYTPLHESVEQGNEQAAKLLVLAGARKDILNHDNLTPGQLASLLNKVSLQRIVE